MKGIKLYRAICNTRYGDNLNVNDKIFIFTHENNGNIQAVTFDESGLHWYLNECDYTITEEVDIENTIPKKVEGNSLIGSLGATPQSININF